MNDVNKIDFNLKRKKILINKESSYDLSFPMFSIIEFNIIDKCNRFCNFCPRYDKKIYRSTNKKITKELYEKIMIELKEIDYDGMILYSAFGEPLMHDELIDLIALTKKYCNKCHLEIITNGDFINNKNISDMFKNGLDTLLFSFYDGEHQIINFNKIKKDNNLSDEQIKYRKRFNMKDIILSNRAGLLPFIEYVNEPLKKICLYPFYQITVDADGIVLVCPHNWKKTVSVGDTNKDDILDIWNGDEFTFIRKSLLNKNRNFIPCHKCNVDGSLMGLNHSLKWKEYYERT